MLFALGIYYFYLLFVNKWISDDGYIYLSYLKNYVEEGEYVFNPGETVDAGTGFVWLLLLTLCKKVLFFLDYRQVTFVLSFLLSLFSYGMIAEHILRGQRSYLLAVPLMFFTWFFISFSTSGLETPLITFLLIFLFFSVQERGLFTNLNAVTVALLPFVRPELGILLMLYVLLSLMKKQCKPLALLFVTLFSLALLRYAIFGDILPNTAFVKLFTDTHNSGYWYFVEFFYSYPYYFLLLAAFMLTVAYLLYMRRFLVSDTFFSLSVFLLMFYVYISGGDFMHGRFFLAPIVLMVLFTANALEKIMFSLPERLKTAVMMSLSFFLLAYALPAQPYCRKGDKKEDKTEKKNWFHGIMDEQAGYEADNPNLHLWKDDNAWKWLPRTLKMSELARSSKIKLGAVYPAIGQVRFYSDPEYFYVFDRLSLTQVAGSFLHMRGKFSRVGHTAEMPDPLIYLNERVTLYHTPDTRLDALLTFHYRGEQAILISLSYIDRFIQMGLLEKNTWEKVDRYVEAYLKRSIPEPNVIFFLKYRYPPERKLYKKIEALYAQYEQSSASGWISWYRENQTLLQRISAIQEGRSSSLPERYRIYLSTGTLKPIKSP